ncbi:unnamed protein product [marine sediment metagenome]|uniref:Uncharacterized protein n=1 Tax=marine sediment metagenome TaxID=412755 RepID=X1HIB9_9ZZZZ
MNYFMTMLKGAERDFGMMDSSSLLEEFFSGYYHLQKQLEVSEPSPYHSRKKIDQSIEQEYQERTKSLREEINRRFPIKS